MAGLGPTYVASTAPEKIASVAAGPALKVAVFGALPRCLVKIPFCTPTSAVACVMFGKKPSLTTVSSLPAAALSSLPHAVSSPVPARMARAKAADRGFMKTP
jgi:hypothetical protein